MINDCKDDTEEYLGKCPPFERSPNGRLADMVVYEHILDVQSFQIKSAELERQLRFAKTSSVLFNRRGNYYKLLRSIPKLSTNSEEQIMIVICDSSYVKLIYLAFRAYLLKL